MSDLNIFDEKMLLTTESGPDPVITYVPESRSYISDSQISGSIIGASQDDGFRRIGIRKVYDKLMYGSRMSNTVQTIIVRCQEGMVDRDVQVICYGKINGGASSLRTGSEISVDGKFDGKSRFVAKRMVVGGADVEIKVELADALIVLLPILLLAVILLWNPIVSMASSFTGALSSLSIPFIGGTAGTMHLIKKKSRYFIPFRYRVKVGLIVGTVLTIVMAILLLR